MKLNRRELLAAFLGAPLAMAACREFIEPESFPEGEIIGQSIDLGHILREKRSFEVPPGNWQNVGVAIIGAGVAGLTAGWKLKKSGFDDLVILELEEMIGGTSRSGKGAPVGYPWGAHYLPVPFRENSDLISLLDDMSLIEGRDDEGEIIISEQFLCREPEERIFFRGRWYEGLYPYAGANEEDRRQLLEFQKEIDHWVDWRGADGKRAFVVPLAECATDAEVAGLDRMPFAEWLRRKGFSSERLIWYCDYACRDDYGLTIEQTSAWAGLFYFCSRVRKSGVDSQPFITFPEGNGRFIEHLGKEIADKILRSHTAVSIVPVEGGVDVICMADGSLRGFHCRSVIFASPVFTAPFVIRGFENDRPFLAGDFEHNAWFVANLFLKGRPRQRFPRDFPPAWDNVFFNSPSLGYVTATHQKGIDHGPTILTYYYPMCGNGAGLSTEAARDENNGRARLFSYGWKELADVALADIARAHPDIYELTERIDIMRWGHAMISPRPNFIWGEERKKALLPYRNIYFAHTDISGIALFEEAFYHGMRTAAAILSVR